MVLLPPARSPVVSTRVTATPRPTPAEERPGCATTPRATGVTVRRETKASKRGWWWLLLSVELCFLAVLHVLNQVILGYFSRRKKKATIPFLLHYDFFRVPSLNGFRRVMIGILIIIIPTNWAIFLCAVWNCDETSKNYQKPSTHCLLLIKK